MIDLENVNMEELERIAYTAGDTLKAKLLARIMDLEDELERVKEDAEDASANSLKAWESDHGPASAYVEFFFDCFKHLRCKDPVPSVTSETDKQVIFDAIARGEGS